MRLACLSTHSILAQSFQGFEILRLAVLSTHFILAQSFLVIHKGIVSTLVYVIDLEVGPLQQTLSRLMHSTAHVTVASSFAQ